MDVQSIAQERGVVTFPVQLERERHYMVPFYKKTGLPLHLKHWQRTVDQMLDEVPVDGPIYLMVDRGFVRAGQTLRRPGLHVDGHWISRIHAHGGDSPGHRGNPGPGRHRGGPTHMGAGGLGKGWTDHPYSEAVLLASDVTGCVAYTGEFDYPTEDFNRGDCAKVDVKEMSPLLFLAGKTYAGNSMFLHESLPMIESCVRTVVRLNVVGWEPSSTLTL